MNPGEPALARLAGPWHKPGVIRNAMQTARHRFGFVLLGMVSCEPAGVRTPAAHASQEIDLTAPSPSEAEPESVPQRRAVMCREGQLENCSFKDSAAQVAGHEELDPSKRYLVEVSLDDPVLGPSEAAVRLVVFSDYQCPFCRVLHDTLGEIRARYPKQVQIVWKDLPLPMHAYARPAALLGREAFARGGNAAFWRVNHELYARQSALSDRVLASLAQDFALSWPPNPKGEDHLNRDLDQVRALNVASTPTTFVNGRPVIGSKPLQVFAAMIDEELRPHHP